MRAMHTMAFVSNRTPLALLYLLLYCQTCLATADEIAQRQDTPSLTDLGKLETPSPVPVGLALVGRQFTETVPPGFSTIFDTSPGVTQTTTTRTTFPPDTPTPPTPPSATSFPDPTSTTTTRTSTSAEGRTTSTTFRDRTPTATSNSGVTFTYTGSSLVTESGITATIDGAEVADPTSSFIVQYPGDYDLYGRVQDLRRFGLAAIVLLVINALLVSTALGFAVFIYFKHFRGQKPSSYAASAFSSSSASLIPNKRQSMVSKATWATPSLSGTVPRALAGRQIPSHHYPRRSWDQVTTIASTSTESERRRRQRVSRVEEESEDASLADTDPRDDPLRRSLQSSMAETDMSMIRSSSGVSVTLESSGRGTGVR